MSHANRQGTDCVFCDIVRGEAAAYVVNENEYAMAILDIQPLAVGHCLVIPKRHVPWWHELSPAEVESVFRLAHAVAGRLMQLLKPDFVALYARGRRIPHTHLFVVPTFGGDPLDRFFNALEGFQESAPALAALRDPKDLAALAARLRQG